jgi:hypothetical protein
MRHAIGVMFLTALLCHATARGQAVLDQSYDPGNVGGFTFNSTNPLAQTFTVGITGQLTQADIRAYNFFGGANAPLTLAIYTVNPGIPFPSLGSLLATASLPQSSVPSTSGFVGFDYSASPPSVTTGQVLAMVASTTGSFSYLWEGRTPGLYPAGQAHSVSGTTLFNTGAGPTFDFGFRTFVRPIPEPGTLLLAGGAATLFLSRIRRRR